MPAKIGGLTVAKIMVLVDEKRLALVKSWADAANKDPAVKRKFLGASAFIEMLVDEHRFCTEGRIVKFTTEALSDQMFAYAANMTVQALSQHTGTAIEVRVGPDGVEFTNEEDEAEKRVCVKIVFGPGLVN